MAKIKLTKSVVDAAAPQAQAIELRDTLVPGFMCKVTPAGRKVFMLQYRTNAGERRKPALGQYGELTVDQAHSLAQEWLAQVRRGGDPAAEKATTRKAPTVEELCRKFMEDYSRKRNKPSTQVGYQGVIDRNIIPLLGRKKVQDVKRPDIATFMEKLAYKQTEANKAFSVLRKMFNLVEVWGLRPDGSNPCRHVPMYPAGEATHLIYAQMASAERWSVRTLRERIDSMLYERTALSGKSGEMIEQELATLRDAQRMSPALIMRDPYILDFLGLQDTWQESDLEAAIIREMEAFLLELGSGFCFVARQKRIQIDGEDFRLDLLFYNRKLRRLVAVELKVGDFKAAYKGQMELYLRWLDKHEREPEEASPLGIILCTGKKREQIELLELDKSGIHVAEYLTALPPKGVLLERLEHATQQAQLQIEQRKTDSE
ncbi:PDDEXK nuclease domain-containing protein [Pseudomonas aeruginosa]